MANLIDLFCGCGGLSHGFQKAGFKVLLGVDNDDIALKTFKGSHPDSEGINADISEQTTDKKIIEIIGKRKVDLIVAGPPCQGFSLTGPRNFDDSRNKLYLSVIRLIKTIRPSAFVIENVPGLATLYQGIIKDEIVKRLKGCGYNVSVKILCAADYGVPQMRKRLFFVGLKKEYGQFEFPAPACDEESYVTCFDAISDLPARENDIGKEEDKYTSAPRSKYQKIMRNGCKILYNHLGTNHTDLVKSVIRLVPEGGNYKDLPFGVGTSRRFNEAWTRYHSKKPSKTIDTGHRNHFHYKYHRVPTIRENARLQSFPDSFRFYGTKTQQNRQVGNAVPPLLGFYIAEKLKEYIKK